MLKETATPPSSEREGQSFMPGRPFRHPLLRLNRGWQGANALVPVDICYAVLDLFGWTVSLMVVVSVVLGYAEYALGIARLAAGWYVLPAASALLAFGATIFRGLPFPVRFAMIALTLLVNFAGNLLMVGVSPSMPFNALVVIGGLGFFYGRRAGWIGLGVYAGMLLASAWCWTHGQLPLATAPGGFPFDFRTPLLWIQVLPIMALFMIALLSVMGLVLRRLRVSLNEANASLQLLATEKAKVQQRSAELLYQTGLLRASEQKFRAVFETANDAIFLLDERALLTCNKRTEDFFDYSREEIVGKSAVEFSPALQPDGLDSEVSAREKIGAAYAGTPQSFEWRFLRRDGTPIDAEVNLSRVELEESVCLAAVVRDVTQRKKAEVALRESEAFRKRVFESSRTPIVVMDAVTLQFVDCNMAAVNIFHLPSREETLGKTPLDISAPVQNDGTASQEKARFYVGKALAEGSVVFEWLGRRPDGEVWAAEVHLMSFESDQRRLLQFTLQDISEKTRAERELRESEARYRGIFENAFESIFQIGLDNRFHSINPSMARAFGYASPGEMMAEVKSTGELYAEPGDRGRLLQLLTQSGRVENLELKLHRRGGQILWALVNARSVKDAAGRTLYYEGSGLDVTEQKRIAELQLEKARAEAANRAKGVFLANISHEIRTPLNAILGFAQLMGRDEALSAAQRDRLRVIGRSGGHLLAIISDLLNMSKIEAKRMTLEPSLFDLPTLARDLQSMFAASAAAKALRFSVETPEDLPGRVLGDEGKLRQILINLLGNAIKFTSRGVVVLRIRSAPMPTDGLRLVAEVEDSGPGIDAAELDRLFQPFEQAALGRKSGTGTGLGLAISREFARLMGGEITVSSEVGRGSVFRVEVPLGLAAPGSSEAGAKPDFQPGTMAGTEVSAPMAHESVAGEPAALPIELNRSLRKAALELDMGLVRALIGQVQGIDADFAHKLGAQAANFDYDRLVSLLPPLP